MKNKINSNRNNEFKALENQYDIMYITARDHYVDLHYRNGKCLYPKQTMEYTYSCLDKSVFLRVHKSHIVNMNFVKYYYKQGRSLALKMLKGDDIPVSKWMKKEFKHMASCFPAITRL